MIKNNNLNKIRNYAKIQAIPNKIVREVLIRELHISRRDLLFLENISEDHYSKIYSVLIKIAQGYPIAYIYNEKEFYGRDFYINENVLIPRDDTSIIIEAYKNKLQNLSTIHIDVGTGSGIIPITLQLENLVYSSLALDISGKALLVANNNIGKYSKSDSIELARSYLLLSKKVKEYIIKKSGDIKGVVITSNLPYIKNEDTELLENNVKLHEPDIALYGGSNTGFELYETLLYQITQLQKDFPDLVFHAIIEIGADQYNISKDYLLNNGFEFEYFKDTNNIYRTIYITKFLGA